MTKQDESGQDKQHLKDTLKIISYIVIIVVSIGGVIVGTMKLITFPLEEKIKDAIKQLSKIESTVESLNNKVITLQTKSESISHNIGTMSKDMRDGFKEASGGVSNISEQLQEMGRDIKSQSDDIKYLIEK